MDSAFAKNLGAGQNSQPFIGWYLTVINAQLVNIFSYLGNIKKLRTPPRGAGGLAKWLQNITEGGGGTSND